MHQWLFNLNDVNSYVYIVLSHTSLWCRWLVHLISYHMIQMQILDHHHRPRVNYVYIAINLGYVEVAVHLMCNIIICCWRLVYVMAMLLESVFVHDDQKAKVKFITKLSTKQPYCIDNVSSIFRNLQFVKAILFERFT